MSFGVSGQTNVEILSKEALTNVAWLSEGVVAATNANWTDAAVSVANHTNALFLWARLADPSLPALPLWWQLAYFGQTGVDPNGDYDGDGLSNFQEYLQGAAPNKINFSLAFPGDHFTSNAVSGSILILGGVPAYAGVLVDDPSFTNVAWSPFSGTVTANLGASEGWHDVWVGLRGLAPNADQSWRHRRLKLDRTPPPIYITAPTTNCTSQPVLQLLGYSPEALSSLTYDLTNPAGVAANQQVIVTHQVFDGTTWEFTTNCFQCFDIPLALGDNTVTLRATDLAGNVTVTNLLCTFSTNGDTTPPAISLCWPLDGTRMGGSNFTWRGSVDDPSAAVVVQAVDSGGNSSRVTGWVERGGLFWVEKIPLSTGTNFLTLTATDLAGNSSATNIAVVQSDVALSIGDFSATDLALGTIDLTGSIASPDYAVWVNGILGANHGDGTWSAQGVPLARGGGDHHPGPGDTQLGQRRQRHGRRRSACQPEHGQPLIQPGSRL